MFLTVDSKGRDAKERLVDPDKLRVELAILVRDDDPARETEVAVEPSVPEASAVRLDTYLEVTKLRPLRDGSDLTFAIHTMRSVGM